MPTVKNVPEGLKPFVWFGMEFRITSDEGLAICPFCDKDKFGANIHTGLWSCPSCNGGVGKGEFAGNPQTFLSLLLDKGGLDDDEGLAEERRLLSSSTIDAWGLRQSFLTGEWLVPEFRADGGAGDKAKLATICRYADLGKGKRTLLAVPHQNGFDHICRGYYGLQLFDPRKPIVYVCEGPWDAMALWEVLCRVKWADTEKGDMVLVPTSNRGQSLIAQANVLAIPGCNVFRPSWGSVLAEKDVCLMMDNDHPRLNDQGVLVPAAGIEGTKRIATILSSLLPAEQPKSVRYIQWGSDGDGYNLSWKAGGDVRDWLSPPPGSGEGSALKDRAYYLDALLQMVQPIPAHFIEGRSQEAVKSGSPELQPLECSSWHTMENSWRKAMKWTPGLRRALTVMLASVASTETIGEQLWVKVMGPPSCGKTTLCEALSIAKKYVFAKSTIRGFHSGYKSDKDGDEDHSLIPLISGKTFVLKDGDTLLQAPNVNQILAEARDLFDGTSRSHYRHGVGRDYVDIRVTWILCGTSSLRSLDTSELGARFIDCVIMEEIDHDFEDEVGERVAHRAFRNARIIANGVPEGRMDPNMVAAKRLTGGYVCYLRENAGRLLEQIEVSSQNVQQVKDLGKFVALMRARPSKKQDEVAEREFSARLIEQYARLAMCTAVVLGKKSLDDEVMQLVTHVALDTARGWSLDLARWLLRAGFDGTEMASLAIWMGESDEKTIARLRFLRKIKVVEYFRHEEGDGTVKTRKKPRWRLNEPMLRLFEEIENYGGDQEVSNDGD